MTKEEFFEKYVNECFDAPSDDIEEVCEGIRTYNGLGEEEFYQELCDYYSGAHYSIISGFNMFTDSIDMETMLEENSEILDWEITNAIYQKATNDTRTLREAYNVVAEESKETVRDFIMEVYSVICSGYNDLAQAEQREFNEELYEYMISIYNSLAMLVWVAPSKKEDSYGNTKHYIIASDYVEFYV